MRSARPLLLLLALALAVVAGGVLSSPRRRARTPARRPPTSARRHRERRQEAQHRHSRLHAGGRQRPPGAGQARAGGARERPHLLGALQRRRRSARDPRQQSRRAQEGLGRLRGGGRPRRRCTACSPSAAIAPRSRCVSTTSPRPEHRLIAAKKFEMPVAQARRLAHKIADEVVLAVHRRARHRRHEDRLRRRGAAESRKIDLMDYDGAGAVTVTTNQSINLSPVWSPDARSLAFTSYMNGATRTSIACSRSSGARMQMLAGFGGINSSPAFSPDGKSVAMTLSQGRQSRDLRADPRDRGAAAAHHATPASTPSRAGRRPAARSRSSPTARAPRTSS